MKTTQDFGTGNVGRLLIGMAVPSIIAMVVNGLYYLVDAAFVGWGVGSSALAGLAQGLQPLAAYNFGADRMGRVKEAEKRALLLSFLLGAGMYLLPLLAPAFTLHLFSDDPLVIVEGIVPLMVVLAAVSLVGVQIIGFTLFQALGQPMKTLAVCLSYRGWIGLAEGKKAGRAFAKLLSMLILCHDRN